MSLPEGPPPIRGVPPSGPLDFSLAEKAIELVRNALPFLNIGPPLVDYGPRGEVHVDVPLIYQGFALDRIHYDPQLRAPSPKGRPVRVWGVRVREEDVVKVMENIIKEAIVVEAVEYRDPELAWIVPLSWKKLIIAHIKVSNNADEIIPDYGLTEEIRRRTL